MPPIVKDLLLQKKFVVALLTAAGSVAAYLGWNVDPNAIIVMMTPLLVYIGAQGWADSGKEKAKVEGATALELQQRHALATGMIQQSAADARAPSSAASVVVVGEVSR